MTPENEQLISALLPLPFEQDFITAAKFIKGHESSNGKLGAVGFCFGGYVVNMLAAAIPETLNAGVPFYGTPAAEEIQKNIKANQVDHTMHMYPEANHGFHNDSTPRCDAKQAELAWERAIAFFKKHLA